MTIKRTLATSALVLVAIITASAQDRITFRNGKSVPAKVKEVATETITYKNWNNQDGPDFVVDKNKIKSIKYANGSQDIMEEAKNTDKRRGRGYGHMHLSNEAYGKNIISAAPVQMANEGPIGFGLQYEYVLDKKNRFSLVLPVALIVYNQFGSGSSEKTSSFKYFNPGVRFYPTGSNRRVSYAIGASASMGMGKRWVNEDGYWGHETDSKYLNLFKAGITINNSLNIQPTKHLYIGVDFGFGIAVYDQENDYRNYFNGITNEPMVNFSFKIGYRF